MQCIVVKNPADGVGKAKEILYDHVDHKTVLFLSGGSTPKSLYQTLATEQIMRPITVGMVDERFGEPMHTTSNELMIAQTGLLDYFANKHIPFSSMLQKGYDREQDGRYYDQKARDLFFHFPKSVAILGLGKDGHIAGIAPNRSNFTNPLFEKERSHLYVSEFDDPSGPFGQRVTMTFAGLTLIDFLLVFVFGRDKQKAIQKAFTPGFLTDCPGRFFQQPEIAQKTVLITDQKL